MLSSEYCPPCDVQALAVPYEISNNKRRHTRAQLKRGHPSATLTSGKFSEAQKLAVVTAASMARTFFFHIVFFSLPGIVMERFAATLFIKDYERTSRSYVSEFPTARRVPGNVEMPLVLQ